MPFVNQRTMSWLIPQIESRPTLKDSPCQECLELDNLSKELWQNFSLLAETGYAEGVMCHTLVKGTIEDKRNVSISVPILVRPRKLLVNILLNHEGLDVLLDIAEHGSAQELFKDAVYSLSILSGHIGVVSPSLRIVDEATNKSCKYETSEVEKDTEMILDDGQIIGVNKNIMCESSGVFGAMLSGQFAESSQKQVKLQETGFEALKCLVHYLYGCRWCSSISNMPPKVLLELTSLTDKYLLSDFNQSVSCEIVKRCMKLDQVVDIYEASLQHEYLVKGTNESLNVCAIAYILVGDDIKHETRAQVFDQLVKSKMSSDFIDDVSRTIREKLL